MPWSKVNFKKILLIFIPATAIATVFIFVLIFIFRNSLPVDPVLRPQGEITYTKGVNIIPYTFEDRDLEESIQEIKNLGANLVVLSIDMGLDEDNHLRANVSGPPDFNHQRQMALIITEAHRQGLYTELRPVTGSPSLQEKRSLDYETFYQDSIDFVTAWSQFAQRYDVYRFTLFGEVDSWRSQFQDSNFEEKIPEYSAALFKEARKHYQGQIGMGFLPPTEELNYEMEGFDYFEISIYVYPTNLYADYRDGFLAQFENAQPLLEKSETRVLIVGETGLVSDPNTNRDPFGALVTPQLRAAYYETLFLSLKDKLDGFITRFEYGESGLRGSLAEEIIKKWYQSL